MFTAGWNQALLIYYFSWLGKWFLFQTFEELDCIKDKELEAQQIRSLLNEQRDLKKEMKA